MDQDRKAKVLDQLRIANKMLESIYQLSQLKSELSKTTVSAWAIRAKAAVEQAEKLIGENNAGGDNIPTSHPSP